MTKTMSQFSTKKKKKTSQNQSHIKEFQNSTSARSITKISGKIKVYINNIHDKRLNNIRKM